MALVCKEIQEKIEETRQEAHEECRNVSRTITETICSWLPWPLDALCNLVTRVITEVVCGIVWITITVVSWVTRVVCEFIYVIDWIVTHVVGFIEWLFNRIITLPEWLFCLAGVRFGRKKLRICPIVIADENGNPVVPLETIQRQIDTAVRIYEQCNVQVIASPITVVQGKSHLANASGCGAGGYFSGDRSEYEHLSCCEGFSKLKCQRFPSGIILPRHILKAVWVDTISSGERGCYMTPESFVLVASSGAVDTLAHEMGHACDLLHRDEPDNLMNTPSRTASNLTGFQCCTIRTSRFVTLL